MKTIILIVFALMFVSPSFGADPLTGRLYSKDFWKRVKAIKEVAELSEEDKRKYFPILLEFLQDNDQTIRTVSAATIAKIGIEPEKAIPALLENYKYPHGEEGYEYVDAVVAYGEAAVPHLNKALDSPEWLIRTRACDTLIQIGRKIDKVFHCTQG